MRSAFLFFGLLLVTVIFGQAEDEPIMGESLFDDDEVEKFKEAEAADEQVLDEPSPDEVTFGSDADEEFLLGKDLTFDETGNVAEGGSRFNPDITFYHVVEFNGERINEPTDGSEMLLQAIAEGKDYTVKLAPPSLDKFKCTEKVQVLERMMNEEYSHEMGEELIMRAVETLRAEGVVNTKQLGELEEKDYDEIRLPALIKTRLRKVRAEARAQAEVAAKPVSMESDEVNDAVREFMEARNRSREGGEKEPVQESAAPQTESGPVVPETEEDGTFKSLVWAVMNCPTCKGKETIACFQTCRYGGSLTGGQGKTWSECLDKCVTNRFLRATLWAMLPRDK